MHETQKCMDLLFKDLNHLLVQLKTANRRADNDLHQNNRQEIKQSCVMQMCKEVYSQLCLSFVSYIYRLVDYPSTLSGLYVMKVTVTNAVAYVLDDSASEDYSLTRQIT